MNKILNKLKNKDGVSLLYSLVAFIVAATVAIVVLSAATSAADVVNNDIEDTQNRLTLISAAQYLETLMYDTELSDVVTYEYVRQDIVNISSTNKGIESIDYDTRQDFFDYIGPMSKEIKEAIEYVDNPSNPFNYYKENCLSIELDSFTDVNTKVNVSMSMNKEYEITFTLKLDGKDENVYLKMIKADVSISDTRKNELYTRYTGTENRELLSDSFGVKTYKVKQRRPADYKTTGWKENGAQISEVK
ncbi:MAG: hypothetical protein Q4B60_08135 [Erysipelotrichaceae bacterium]|nr:hypothetical protein [Erysipelotrichaceae bacterium]